MSSVGRGGLPIQSAETVILCKSREDLPVNSDRATKDDTVKVVDTIPTGEQYGFVVAKENTELQGQLNEGLTAVKDDGTFDTIYESYFPNAGN